MCSATFSLLHHNSFTGVPIRVFAHPHLLHMFLSFPPPAEIRHPDRLLLLPFWVMSFKERHSQLIEAERASLFRSSNNVKLDFFGRQWFRLCSRLILVFLLYLLRSPPCCTFELRSSFKLREPPMRRRPAKRVTPQLL